MEIIAHRGASSDAPENTLEACDLAVQHGADGLEFDVRLAACGTPMVIHDETLLRTHGIPTPVDALSAHDLEALGVPLLATVLWRYGGQMRLFVEAKTAQAALAAADQISLVLRGGVERESVILIAFDHTALAAAKDLHPALITGASFDAAFDPHAARTLACAPAWLPVQASVITPSLVTAAEAENLSLVAWTVNTQQEAQRLHALGIAALMTDTPLQAREWLF